MKSVEDTEKVNCQDIQWSLALSLRPWNLLIYPWSMLHIRTQCLPWLQHPTCCVGTYENYSSHLRNRKNSLNLSKPNASSPLVLHQTIFASESYTLYLIWQAEGLSGLFRGVFLYVTHRVLIDLCNYSFLVFFYPRLKLRLQRLALWMSREPTLCYGARFHDSSSDFQKRNTRFTIEKQCYPVHPFSQSEQNARPLAKHYTNLHPVNDIAHLILKLGVEVLLYPLVALHTKFVVYDGVEVCNPLHFFGILWKSQKRYQTFFSGFAPYFAVKLFESMGELMCYSLCEKYDFNEDKTLKLQSTLSDFSTIIFGPLLSLARIQQAQSKLPGLGSTKTDFRMILNSMSWKAYSANLILTALTRCWQYRDFFCVRTFPYE